MKGVREAAMSQEEPEVAADTWYDNKYPRTSFYDEYNPTRTELGRYYDDAEMSCYNKKENEIVITLYISREEMGDTLEKYYQDFDWTPVEDKAIVLGYKRLSGLLCKDYLENYSITFSGMEGLDEVELTATLTKLK